MEENQVQEKELKNKVKEQVDNHIKAIIDNGLQVANVDLLGKLIDIQKDLSNQEYWKKKEEVMENDVR